MSESCLEHEKPEPSQKFPTAAPVHPVTSVGVETVFGSRSRGIPMSLRARVARESSQ